MFLCHLDQCLFAAWWTLRRGSESWILRRSCRLWVCSPETPSKMFRAGFVNLHPSSFGFGAYETTWNENDFEVLEVNPAALISHIIIFSVLLLLSHFVAWKTLFWVFPGLPGAWTSWNPQSPRNFPTDLRCWKTVKAAGQLPSSTGLLGANFPNDSCHGLLMLFMVFH